MTLDLRQFISPAPFSPASNDALRRMVESIPSEAVDSTRRLFDLLDEAHRFSVPGWMIEREFRAIWRQVIVENKAGEIEPEDVGKSDVQLKEEYRAIAERRVRLGLVVKAIAKRNNIRLDREDITVARANGYCGPFGAILESKIVEFIFGLGRA